MGRAEPSSPGNSFGLPHSVLYDCSYLFNLFFPKHLYPACLGSVMSFDQHCDERNMPVITLVQGCLKFENG